jgi:hypothetical protein
LVVKRDSRLTGASAGSVVSLDGEACILRLPLEGRVSS